MNDVAHRMFRRSATEHEINALPRYDDESEIALLRNVELLQIMIEQMITDL